MFGELAVSAYERAFSKCKLKMKHLKKHSINAQTHRYIAIADVLRVSAIALIAWHHFWQLSWLDPSFYAFGRYIDLFSLVSAGYMMVDVIIVLSGFLIAIPYAQAHCNDMNVPRPIAFYRKRIRRIIPSYLLALTITIIFYALPQGLYTSIKDGVLDLLAHLTFTHNLFPKTYFSSPLPGVLWTLAVEVQFYVLFPYIGKIYGKHPILVCVGLTIAALGFRAWVYDMQDTTFWVNQLPCMLDLYACGMMAAFVYTRASSKKMRDGWLWCMSALAVVSFAGIFQIIWIQDTTDYELLRHEQLLWRLPIGILTGMTLFFGALSHSSLQSIMGNRITKFLAEVSYNYYIWHQFLAGRLKAWRIPRYISEKPHLMGEQPWQIRYTILCFLVAGFVASIVTYTIEKPFSDLSLIRQKSTHWREKMLKRKKGAGL